MKKIISVCLGFFIISNIYFLNSANASECSRPKISAPGYWPGFVSVNTEGKQTGKAFEIAERILSPLMGELIVDMHKPWARILKELESGNIDIVVGILKSRDRQKKFIFTDPWMSSEWGVITLDHTVVQWAGVNSLDWSQFTGRIIRRLC